MTGVLIVTGAGRGIGAACARAGGGRGYKVCVNYNTSASRAQAIADDIVKAGGQAIAVKADVTTEAGAKSLFETVDRELGTVTALVNNAGTILPQSRVDDCEAGTLELLFKTNVISQFLCAREAIRRMSTKHGGSGGAIVNISSVHSRLGAPGLFVSYAATKGAIETIRQRQAAAERAEQVAKRAVAVAAHGRGQQGAGLEITADGFARVHENSGGWDGKNESDGNDGLNEFFITPILGCN